MFAIAIKYCPKTTSFAGLDRTSKTAGEENTTKEGKAKEEKGWEGNKFFKARLETSSVRIKRD